MNIKPLLSFLLLMTLTMCSQDKAKESFDRAVELKKNGKLAEAVKEYDNAIKIRPDFEVALINRGNLKNQLQDHKGAIEDYDKAEKIEPNDPEVYYNRGNAKHALTLYAEA